MLEKGGKTKTALWEKLCLIKAFCWKEFKFASMCVPENTNKMAYTNEANVSLLVFTGRVTHVSPCFAYLSVAFFRHSVCRHLRI